MNTPRLLAGLLSILLPSVGAVCHGQRVYTIDDISSAA